MCRKVINTTENMFNIKTFVKKEYKDFQLSKGAIKTLKEMIETVTMVVVDNCVKNAEAKGNKTILPQHFDWDNIEEFKNWIEEKKMEVK